MTAKYKPSIFYLLKIRHVFRFERCFSCPLLWKRVERATEFMQGPSPVVHGTKISRRIALRLGCGEQSVEPNQKIRPYFLDITSRSVDRTHTQVSTMPLVSPDTWNLLLYFIVLFLYSFNR
ncbi:unnamed protein product [Brassica rapa subsp. trilocularis]